MSHSFSIVPRGSFSFDATRASLMRLAPLRHVWSAAGDEITLSLLCDGDLAPVRVALRFDGALHGTVDDAARAPVVARQVARIFSLDHDGAGWDEIVAREPPMAELVREIGALRPVCFPSPYEAACWAIVSQRISMAHAAKVMASLVARHGSFPSPDALRKLGSHPGLSAVKIERLRGVADAALDGVLDAERLRALGDEEAPLALRRIAGIGPFWSSGIYLRACGIADVFPAEPRALAALARRYDLGASPSEAAVAGVTSRFRPFRMWACYLLRVADARRGPQRAPERGNLTSGADANRKGAHGSPHRVRSARAPEALVAVPAGDHRRRLLSASR